MFDTSIQGIINCIKIGDSQHISLKLSLPTLKKLERIFNAFANTEGGIVVVGVADDGKIKGLNQHQVTTAFDRFKEVSKVQFSWPIDMGVADVYGETLVYAVIAPAPHPLAPVYTSDNRTYFRVDEFIRSPTIENERKFHGLLKNVKEKKISGGKEMSATENLIFLSYAKEDLVEVQKLYSRLKAAQLTPWMDKPPKERRGSGL